MFLIRKLSEGDSARTAQETVNYPMFGQTNARGGDLRNDPWACPEGCFLGGRAAGPGPIAPIVSIDPGITAK
jgi:hypothetical protein